MRVPLPSVLLQLVLSAAITVQTVGCTSWQVQQVSPGAWIEVHHPPKVQVRHADVHRVAVRKFSPLKTLGLTALIVGGFFGFACLMACGY